LDHYRHFAAAETADFSSQTEPDPARSEPRPYQLSQEPV